MKTGGTIDGGESESAKGSGENGGWEESAGTELPSRL